MPRAASDLTHVAAAWWSVDDLAAVFSLGGEVDLSNAADVRDAIESASAGVPEPVLVVDLTELRFIDAAGVRALLAAAEAIAPTQLVLRRPSAGVRRVLDLAVPGAFTVEG